MIDVSNRLQPTDFPPIKRGVLDTLQVNLGYQCNQTCQHCHVNAGPNRKETMASETAAQIIRFLRQGLIKTLDLTGGAPELNQHFKTLVKAARSLNIHVIDRCNLTILYEPGQEDLANFLADNQVEIVASLPCYLEENVEQQRGKGVYTKSIQALLDLNKLGYGVDPDLKLRLVYNPLGPILPPSQEALEVDYRRALSDRYGIVFTSLLTLTNMPIKRFGSILASKGQFEDYMVLLKASHRDENLEHVMCRSLLSVDWQGYVFDCDFNQMLEMPIKGSGGASIHISDLSADRLINRQISIGEHCYGCTAGSGSSCGGALL